MVFPHGPQGACDADRRVAAGDCTEHHRQCEVLNGLDVVYLGEDINNGDAGKNGDVCVYRTRHRLCDARVYKILSGGLRSHDGLIFPNSVVNNDRIVDREADDRQYRGDERVVERYLENYEYRGDYKSIMEKSYDSHEACRESADFSEAVTDINKNQCKREQDSDYAVPKEARSGERFDRERLGKLKICVGIGFHQRGSDGLLLLRGDRFIVGKADNKQLLISGRNSLLLTGRFFAERTFNETGCFFAVDRTGVGVLQNGAALELDIKLDAVCKSKDDAGKDDCD